MREHEPRGVQKRALEVRHGAKVARHAPAHAAVERIADDRMADRAEVHTNLVRPAGVNRDLRQRQHAGRSAPRRRSA